MLSSSLIAFIGTAIVVVVTPGLDTAFVLRTAAAEGRRNGVCAAIGIGLGCLCWGGAAAFGLGALLAASPAAFALLKTAGAAYLLWLGIRLLARPRAAFEQAQPRSIVAASPGAGALKRGFATNILNPKVGVFYLTLLPQFVPAGAEAGWYSFGLASLHVFLATTWFTILATVTASARHLLRQPNAMPALDRITGGVFVAFGLHLALG
jgi:threonine/homoserine/homoserine lactone efflux protein